MRKNIILAAVVLAVGILLGDSIRAPADSAEGAGLGDWLRSLFSPVPTASTTSPEIVLYKPDSSYENAVIRATAAAEPSVVSIIISKNLPVIERCAVDPFFDIPDEFRDFFGDFPQFTEPCEKSTKKQEIGGGTGFIVSENGYIVTNKHVVIDEKAEYTVLMNNGKKCTAKVAGRDPGQDVAVIKIDATRLTPLSVGDSDGIRLGQSVIAIGNALGEFRNTVSVGVISGLSRSITARGAGFSENIEGLFQTDAAINPGNSGGPLLNLKGEVIGINTAVAGGAQNIGFAIPINNAKRAIESVKKAGTIKTPFLGVRYLIITSELKERETLPVESGALIRGGDDGPAVVRNSPAEKAGLRAEDIVTAVGGVKIDSAHTLGMLLQKYDVGDMVILIILRDGKELKITATLEEKK